MNSLKAIKPEIRPYASIVWQVSDHCNFRCSYCSEYNWGGKNRNKDFQKIEDPLRRIFSHYKKLGYQDFKLFFSGGEPTMWEPLLQVIEMAKSELPRVRLAVNTNLSREPSWWQKNYHHFDDVVASYHIENARPDRYLENYKFLCDKVNYLCARMMMHEERFDEVIAFSERFKSEIPNFKLEWVPLFKELSNTTAPWDYKNEAHRKFFESHTFETGGRQDIPSRSEASTGSVEIYETGETRPLNSNRLVIERKNFFAGWKCWIHESIFINAQGVLSFATCGQMKPVGNFYQNDFNLISEPILCQKEQCHCGTDIYITKERAK
jgi:organic radical activating enzyme